jgi:hypothetical protein
MTETTVEQDVKQSPAETTSEEKTSQVPYARFKELVDEKNTFKTQLEDLQTSIKTQTEERKLKDLEAKGEYETILTDMKSKLATAETKANAFDTYQESRRESLLSKLPEDDRAIYDGLSLEKLEVHVDKFNSKPNPAAVDNSKPNPSNTFGGYDNIVEMATRNPKEAEKWLAHNVENYKIR